MSLINQMLKDLERRSNTVAHTAYSVPSLTLSSGWSSRFQGVFLFLIFVLVGGVLSWLLLKPSQPTEIDVSVTQQTLKAPGFVHETTQPSAVNVSDELHNSASIMTGLTLQIQKPMTIVKLSLSQETLYRIGKKSNNEYVITLLHAKLVTSLPSINTENSAIDTIKMINQQDGSLFILLRLKEGADLTAVSLNKETKYPELQINIHEGDEHEISTTVTQMSATHPLYNKPIIENNLVKSLITTGPENDYEDALAQLSQNDTAKAIITLKQIVNKFPAYLPARESLIKALIDTGRIIEAKESIQVGLQKKPLYPPFAEFKAKILANEGQVDDAIQLLQQSAPSMDQNPEHHALIAALYQRKGQSLLAAKMYEQLLPMQPDNAVWWMGLGIAYEDLGKRNEAMQAYARADTSSDLNPELKAYVQGRMHSLQ